MKKIELFYYNSLPYIRKYWFQSLLVGISLFVFLHKDLSFSVSLKTPKPVQTADAAQARTKQNVAIDNSETPLESQAGFLPVTAAKPKAQLSATKAQQAAFVQRFRNIAKQEAAKYHIPTAIILAQAILQSQAGATDAAKNANNFFNLPCTDGWVGKRYTHALHCYRSYGSAWASFRDHSEYISSGAFTHLKYLKSSDYKAWAMGLQQAGYSKEAGYGDALIAIIEDNNL